MAITLFPLLVSNTVSKNIVPGVAKVLENYIITYGLDAILSQMRSDVKSKGNYRISNNKVIKREDVSFDISNFLYNEMLDEAAGDKIRSLTGPGTKGQSRSKPAFSYVPDESLEAMKKKRDELKKQRDALAQAQAKEYDEKIKDMERTAYAKEKGKQAASAKDASVRIDLFNMDSISLEPTWMKMDQIDKDGVKTSGIIGVKVIPYLVKSDASLTRLLMYDNQVGNLQGLAIRTGRKMTTVVYKVWVRLWKFLTLGLASPKDTVSGDPRRDILTKRSIMHTKDIQHIFALASQSDLSDDFISSAKGMMKLQKMGWGSLIIADDVNRRVAFCMKELKGMCSMMPYTMLYQTFSQAKVYEDIEDAKRVSSSIFKVRRERLGKLIGESIADNKIEEFGNQNLPLLESSFISEAEYIDENIGSFLKKITPASLKIMLPNLIKGKMKNVPSSSPEKVVKIATKLNPEFRKGYVLARKVIGNSLPDTNKELVDWAAIMIAIRASLKRGGSTFMEEVKNGIKKSMRMFRRSSSKAKMPKEHIVDATFGWIFIIGGLSFIAWLYTKAAYVGMNIWKTINPIYKSMDAKLSGMDMETARQWGEDLATDAAEPLKDTAVEWGPWIGLTLFTVIIINRILYKR